MLFYHDSYSELTQTHGHPECPERVRAIVARLPEVISDSEIITPIPATREQLALAHTIPYIDMIEQHPEGYMDADTYIRPNTFEMASMAAGGTIQAADWSYENKRPSYAMVRPPGHHAGKDYGGGFCYFNNVAIAAEHLLAKVRKVAIVDIDVHHGNGTNDIFQDSKDVLYISTHQYGIYPGTGHFNDVGIDEGEGFNINIPLPSGSGDGTFDHAFDSLIIPILRQYKPEALLISFGGDAHYRDQLASLTLSSKGYLDQISKLLALGKELCENRMTILLEGGYDTDALAEVVCGTLAMFKDQEFPLIHDEVMDIQGSGNDWVDKAKEVQSRYWEF